MNSCFREKSETQVLAHCNCQHPVQAKAQVNPALLFIAATSTAPANKAIVFRKQLPVYSWSVVCGPAHFGQYCGFLLDVYSMKVPSLMLPIYCHLLSSPQKNFLWHIPNHWLLTSIGQWTFFLLVWVFRGPKPTSCTHNAAEDFISPGWWCSEL